MMRWYLCFQLLLIVCLVESVAAQQLPELTLDHAAFDRIEVELLVKNLQSEKYAQREEAEREIKQMLKESGFPLWHFLMNLETQGQGLTETRVRMERILKSLKLTEGDIYHLKDWQGNPLPKVFCEVYEMTREHFVFDKHHAKLVGRTISKENGDVRLPDLTSASEFPDEKPDQNLRPRLGIIVHAPGYGAAGVVVNSYRPDVFLPIVKDGSNAALRAGRGTIVDEAGKPIQGVAIKPISIEIPGQGGYNVRGEGLVFSDHKGRFRVYGWPYNTANKIVPVGAKHKMRLSAEGFFPQTVHLENDGPKKLVLSRGQKFYRFSFNDPKVPEDPKGVEVYREEPESPRTLTILPKSFITEGGRLLPGTYVGEFHDGRGYGIRFKPILVNESSPELLKFELPDAITFKGKVFDGITGDPAAGVVVYGAYSSMEKKLVSITDEQLESLQSASLEELEGHPTALALGEVQGVKVITKTNEKGTYCVTLAPDVKIYGFYMVAPRMLPYEIRALTPEELRKKSRGKEPKEINEDGSVQLGPMFRFPAARVHFSPRLPAGSDPQQRVTLWPEWKIDDSVQPPWFARFMKAKKARHGLPGFYPSFYWIDIGRKEVGKQQTLTVPAGIKLKLQLKPSDRTGLAPLHVAEELLLEPGEEHDLGQFELRNNVQVQVLVVDANGNGIEGVSIRRRYSDSAWSVGVATDFSGRSTFGVSPDLKGEFGALNINGPEGRLRDKNLKVPFDISNGESRTFTIRLTDEQLALLPREGNE